MEKKQKKIDQQIAEAKSKYEAKEAELEDARREARNYNTEVCYCNALYVMSCTYVYHLCIAVEVEITV